MKACSVSEWLLATVAVPGMHLGLKITSAPAKSILGISAFFPCSVSVMLECAQQWTSG